MYLLIKIDAQLYTKNYHNAPYVITKPFHHSQKVVEKFEDGSIIVSLKVHINFEFEKRMKRLFVNIPLFSGYITTTT